MQIIKLILTSLALVFASPAQATTGLGGMEGLVWIYLLALLIAVAAVVIVVVYFFKYFGKEKPGNIFRVITIAYLLLCSPIFYFAVSATGLSTAWFLCVVIYMAVFTVGLLSFFSNRLYVFAGVGVFFFAYLMVASQTVSLTAYQIIDNKVFEPTHVLAARLGSKYLRTSDGQLYRLVSDQLPRKELFEIGTEIQMEDASSTGSIGRLYNLNTVAHSSAYYWHERENVKPMFTIPFRTIIIQKSQSRFIGRVESLSGADWKATSRDVNSALYHDCCDANFIKELIDHGAEPTEIAIGSRNILHFLANNIQRHEGIVETAAVLIAAGVDVNQIDEWGKSPLLVAVEGAGSRHFERPAMAARFIGFIQLLLRAGADPDTADVLYQAVFRKRYQIARLLLERGADPGKKRNDKNDYFSNAFNRATSDLKNSTDEVEKEVLAKLIGDMKKVMK